MGKDLRGKELGVGICQGKNKKYIARFTNRNGKRVKREFDKLQECRNWLATAQFEDEHGNALMDSNPTVDSWYNYWIENIKGNNVRLSTKMLYKERYERDIRPLIGGLELRAVKPIHCQNILNQMAEKYSDCIIKRCKAVMQMIFESALENELIDKSPVTRSVKCASLKSTRERRALTVDEQRNFLESMKNSRFYNEYALVLQTGIRVGELTGLHWSDIDFENRLLHIRRSMWYNRYEKKWSEHEPKTQSGFRDIPLTSEAISILKNQKEKSDKIKIRKIEFSKNVFIREDGELQMHNRYDGCIGKYCKKTGIKKFSMHELRHTFATRCIESGMKPKTLQKILGHSAISITMDLYAHVTYEEEEKEIQKIEEALKLVR